jgi:hypothetical protein
VGVTEGDAVALGDEVAVPIPAKAVDASAVWSVEDGVEEKDASDWPGLVEQLLSRIIRSRTAHGARNPRFFIPSAFLCHIFQFRGIRRGIQVPWGIFLLP